MLCNTWGSVSSGGSRVTLQQQGVCTQLAALRDLDRRHSKKHTESEMCRRVVQTHFLARRPLPFPDKIDACSAVRFIPTHSRKKIPLITECSTPHQGSTSALRHMQVAKSRLERHTAHLYCVHNNNEINTTKRDDRGGAGTYLQVQRKTCRALKTMSCPPCSLFYAMRQVSLSSPCQTAETIPHRPWVDGTSDQPTRSVVRKLLLILSLFLLSA